MVWGFRFYDLKDASRVTCSESSSDFGQDWEVWFWSVESLISTRSCRPHSVWQSLLSCLFSFLFKTTEVWKPSDLVWVFPPTCQLLKRRNVIRTQAIIQVGSKLRSNPEENSHLLKGFGLRMGYECWCFFETKSSDPTLPQDQEKRRTDQLSRLNANFHIIVQGRYSVNDALQLEDTLDKSFVTCNHCKNQIVFWRRE